MSRDAQLKQMLDSLRERSIRILNERHTGADAKSVINDLFASVERLVDMLTSSADQSSDVRVLRKKLEHGRQEMEKTEARMAELTKQILRLATEIEMINREAGQIISRNSKNPTSPDSMSAGRIRDSAQTIVWTVKQLLKPPENSGSGSGT